MSVIAFDRSYTTLTHDTTSLGINGRNSVPATSGTIVGDVDYDSWVDGAGWECISVQSGFLRGRQLDANVVGL